MGFGVNLWLRGILEIEDYRLFSILFIDWFFVQIFGGLFQIVIFDDFCVLVCIFCDILGILDNIIFIGINIGYLCQENIVFFWILIDESKIYFIIIVRCF